MNQNLIMALGAVIGIIVISVYASISSPINNEEKESIVTTVIHEDFIKNTNFSSHVDDRKEFKNSEKADVKDEVRLISFSDISDISEDASKKSREIILERNHQPSFVPPEKVHYFQLNLSVMLQMKVGDTFDIAFPQTTEIFSVEVTEAESYSDGYKSVKGIVIGDNSQISFTVGRDAVYGSISVYSGYYKFESSDQYAWIYNDDDNEARLEGNDTISLDSKKFTRITQEKEKQIEELITPTEGK